MELVDLIFSTSSFIVGILLISMSYEQVLKTNPEKKYNFMIATGACILLYLLVLIELFNLSGS